MGNWKTDYIATKFSPDVIPQMKKDYAKLLATHNRDSEKAFLDPQMDIIFSYDVSAKLYAKNNWIFDEEVKTQVEHYLNKGLGELLPTKEHIAKMLYDIAVETVTPRDKILALKEYADIMGYNQSDNENSGAVQNVILVADNGDNLTWEEKMLKQQQDLKERTTELLMKH